MQTLKTHNASRRFDVVFVGNSISNLLSATSLLERFEGLSVKILTSPDQLQQVGDNVTAVSSASHRGLMDISPELPSALNRASFTEQEGSGLGFIRTRQFHEQLISGLPETCLVSDWSIRAVHQKAEEVEMELENGERHFTKLLIEDPSHSAQLTSCNFVETSLVISKQHQNHTFTNWNNEQMYVSCHSLSTDIDFVSCVAPSSLSLDSLLNRLESPELMDCVITGQAKAVYHRVLHKLALIPVQGRYAQSGEIGQFIPNISIYKLEQEIEEALFLRKAIFLKGLTAAALSDWKRRMSNSSLIQALLPVLSPIGLLVESNMDKSAASDVLKEGKGERKQQFNEDIGKPLVCSPEKHTMIWHIVD
eukprot:g2513.t1